MFLVHFSILVTLCYIVHRRGNIMPIRTLFHWAQQNPVEKTHLHLNKAAESTLQIWLNTGTMTEISIALKQCEQRRPGFNRSDLNCIPYVPAQHPRKGRTVAAISCSFQHGLYTIKESWRLHQEPFHTSAYRTIIKPSFEPFWLPVSSRWSRVFHPNLVCMQHINIVCCFLLEEGG